MKDEEGNDIPLTVIEYILYSLADDNIELSDPLYERILKEGIEHVKDEGFKAESFFVNHPDADINKLAANLCMDNVPLSKLHGELPADERLDEIVPNLIASLKLSIVQENLKAIIEQSKKPETRNNKDLLRSLMAEFNEKAKRAKELAKECGERVILK
jgi:DNA primase